jgi:hypothetical protein
MDERRDSLRSKVLLFSLLPKQRATAPDGFRQPWLRLSAVNQRNNLS